MEERIHEAIRMTRLVLYSFPKLRARPFPVVLLSVVASLVHRIDRTLLLIDIAAIRHLSASIRRLARNARHAL